MADLSLRNVLSMIDIFESIDVVNWEEKKDLPRRIKCA
jgi:hypothetical protein